MKIDRGCQGLLPTGIDDYALKAGGSDFGEGQAASMMKINRIRY